MYEAGVKSLFPALSSERTLNVCVPSITLTVLVLTQVTKGLPSKLHSNLFSDLPSMSDPENENFIELDAVLPLLTITLLSPSIAVFIMVFGVFSLLVSFSSSVCPKAMLPPFPT